MGSADTESGDALSPLAEQWPHFKYLGLGVWWAWIWLCYNSVELMSMFPQEIRPGFVLTMYLFSTLGIASSMVVAAFLWKQITPVIDRRLVVIGFGFLAGAATLLLGLSSLVGEGIYFSLAAVLTGIGTSFLCLKVGRLYGSVSLGDSLTAGSLSLLLSALLYFVGIGIPSFWRLFYIAALPLIAAVLLSLPITDPYATFALGKAEKISKGTPPRKLYHRLVIAAALVALTAGIGKGIASSLTSDYLFAQEGSIAVFAIGLIAVVIVFVINQGDGAKGVRHVYSALMVLGIAMMLATCFGFNISYLSIGKEALWLIFSCLMAYIAFRFEFSSIRLFGFGQAVYFLFSTAGWALGALIAPVYQESMVRMGVGVLLAFMVILVLVYVFTESDIKKIMDWSTKGGEKEASEKQVREKKGEMFLPEEEAGVSLTAAVKAIQSSYGLSQRELEILDLFAQGRSANWIADHLMISKNTVRSHLRAVYVKLDIHTRQELLDFLNL